MSIKCFFGFHDFVAHTVDYGPVHELLGAILVVASLSVRAESKNGHYIEYWRKCSRCGVEKPRGYAKDVHDVEQS